MVRLFVGSLLSVVLALMSVSAMAQEREWYEGGNLHKATLAQWAAGSTSNRLATAADFAVAMSENKKQPFSSLKQAMSASLSLADCLDEVAQEPAAKTQKASQVAATCWILLER